MDGHREKTLALLWQIIFHFQVIVKIKEPDFGNRDIGTLRDTLRRDGQVSFIRPIIVHAVINNPLTFAPPKSPRFVLRIYRTKSHIAPRADTLRLSFVRLKSF